MVKYFFKQTNYNLIFTTTKYKLFYKLQYLEIEILVKTHFIHYSNWILHSLIFKLNILQGLALICVGLLKMVFRIYNLYSSQIGWLVWFGNLWLACTRVLTSPLRKTLLERWNGVHRIKLVIQTFISIILL